MARRRWVVRAFPRSWRARLGEQLTGLLDDMEEEAGRIPAADRFDVARAGLTERFASVRKLSLHPRVLVAASLAVMVTTAGALAFIEGTSPTARMPTSTSTTSTTQRQGTTTRTPEEIAAAQTVELQAAAQQEAAQLAAAQAAAQRAAAQAASQSSSSGQAAAVPGQ